MSVEKQKKILRLAIVFLVVEILFFMKFRLVIPKGTSMLPTLRGGFPLLCARELDYEEENIVVYRINGYPIAHRIVKVDEYDFVKLYWLKGDNNEERDMFPIYRENIVCKILGH